MEEIEMQTLDSLRDLKAVTEAGEIEGYAAVFDVIDDGLDVVARGAFRRSLKERGSDGIRLLWQHDVTAPLGRILEIKEDETGLYIRAKLLDTVQRGREALELLRAKAISGLSIGYRARETEFTRRAGRMIRVLKDVDLEEISLVTFPMNRRAGVTAVKEMLRGGRMPPPADLERLLREACGLSRSQAKGLLARGYNGLLPRDEATARELATTLRQLAKEIRHV